MRRRKTRETTAASSSPSGASPSRPSFEVFVADSAGIHPSHTAAIDTTRGTGSAPRQGYFHTTRGTTHRGRGGGRGGDEERLNSADRSSTCAEAWDLISGVFASNSTENHLRGRLKASTCQVFRLGSPFVG